MAFPNESSPAKDQWVIAGYEEFALHGLDGIKVERLAKKLNRNKSSYYHFFLEQPFFYESLIDHHVKVSQLIKTRMSQIQSFDPDFLQILLDFRTAILVHSQLVTYRKIDLFAKYYGLVNLIVETAVIPKWSEYIGLKSNHKVAAKLFEIFQDMFYSRITPELMNEDFLRGVITEAKSVTAQMIKFSQFDFPNQTEPFMKTDFQGLNL